MADPGRRAAGRVDRDRRSPARSARRPPRRRGPSDIATGNAVIRPRSPRSSASSSRSGGSASSSSRPAATASADSHEIPFALAPDAPPLAADAPGSAAVRVGADIEDVSPARALAHGAVRPVRLSPTRRGPDALAAGARSRYPVPPDASAADVGRPGRPMIDIPVEDFIFVVCALDRRRPAADHRPGRRHPRRGLRLRRRRRVAHAAAAVVRLDVRRRRPVRDPGPRRARRPGGARRGVGFGLVGLGDRLRIFSALRRAEAPDAVLDQAT